MARTIKGRLWNGVWCALALIVVGTDMACGQDDDPVFSGPQIGEAMPAFDVKPLFRDADQTTTSLALGEKEGLHVALFVTEVTRPGFAVIRTISNYAGALGDRVHVQVVFLTSDIVAKQQWAQGARQILPKSAAYYVSPDGAEGPGTLGLNRHVELTVLLIRESKVVANFALVQPGDAVDSPIIIEAIAQALGMTPPDAHAIAAFREASHPAGSRMMRESAAEQVDLRPLLGPVIQLSATDTSVEEAAQRVIEEAEKNEPFRRRLGEACKRIVESGKLESYGTPRAQAFLKEWAE
ncbi:MAG TPA: hypothetical protein PKD54_12635, partial [Pirellulaceae bacterium]|nr:hypothetical protein [Pirellulaceae bacterium]